MSNKRRSNTKNWAAIRRKSRRVEQARATERVRSRRLPVQMRPSRDRAFIGGLTIIGNPEATGIGADGPADIQDVILEGFDTGVAVGPEGDVRARGLHLRTNRIGVDNNGRFDGADSQID